MAVVVAQQDPVNWAQRLVWAQLSLEDDGGDDRKLWWPALLFNDVAEFDQENEAEAAGNFDYRADLAMCMMERTLEGASAVQVVRFLGRPLGDVQPVAENEYYDFVRYLGQFLQACARKPATFQESARSPEEAETLYMDFHRGMDRTTQILSQSTNRKPKIAKSWVTQAEEAWEAAYGTKPSSSSTTTQVPGPPGAALPTALSPQRASFSRPNNNQHQHPHASPNHSVAAVSVADESLVSAMHHTGQSVTNTPASTVASGISRYSEAKQQESSSSSSDEQETTQQDHQRQFDYSKFPKVDALGMIPWKEAWIPLRCAGWSRFKVSDDKFHYQPYGGGPELSQDELQRVARELYGWKESAPPKTPTQTRSGGRRDVSVPESNGKDYSFGILWKHKCVPNGWTRVKPPKEAAKFFDYYYLRPGVTLENLDSKVKGEDYFDDHWEVVAWCRLENYYPTDQSSSSSVGEGTAGDESSVATYHTADDPATVLEEVKSEIKQHRRGQQEDDQEYAHKGPSKKKGPAKKKSKKKKKSEPSPRNYSFGVLWASHLEPNGWTMPPAKRNPLADYYYVRPGCSHQTGKLNIDYFANPDDVLKYCNDHHDYPDLSSCYASSPDEATVTTAADASTIGQETSDDESTKHPPETDDDRTVGGYSTPGTRTQPQDPAKPLSSDEDESELELADSQKYHWKNLWPFLQNLGWKWKRSKNPLENYRYNRPRKLTLVEGAEQKEMTRGVDYFCTPEEVTEYCTEMDRREAALIKKSKKKASVEPMEEDDQETQTKPSKKSKRDAVPVKKKARGKVQDEPSRNESIEKDSQKTRSEPVNKPNKKRKADQQPKNQVKKASSWKDISVRLDDSDENMAPWVIEPLPQKNLHKLVMSVGRFQFGGAKYVLRNELNENVSPFFDDVSEALQHVCRLGRGNYYTNPKASSAEIKKFTRLVDYAFVPGRDYDHCKTRALTQQEIELCLEKLFNFTRAGNQWEPPSFLTAEADSNIEPGKLRSSYDSLPELLRRLRGVEHLEGDFQGRRRKSLNEKEEIAQKEQLTMAFRLSIAEEKIIDSFKNKVSARGRPRKEPADVMEFQSDAEQSPNMRGPKIVSSSQESAPKGKKRPNCSTPSSSAKKKKECNVTDLKVKADASNKAPWVKLFRADWWPVVRRLGVTYLGGFYYLPDEDSRNNTARFSSVDAIFQHWCTYGGYNFKSLKKDEVEAVMFQIRYGNVPSLASSWKQYRKLEIWEATLILNLFQFEEQKDKSWSVPDHILQQTNIYREGNPPLLKKQYPSLDELRVALRSIQEFEKEAVSRRARNDRKLNENQYIAFRLWLADGPEGPIDTTVPKTSSDPEDDADMPSVEEAATSSTAVPNAIVDPIVDQPVGSQNPSTEPKEDAAMPSAEEAATSSTAVSNAIVDPIVDQPAGSQNPSSDPEDDADMPSVEEAATSSTAVPNAIVDPIVDQPVGPQNPSTEPKEDAAMPSAEEAATSSTTVPNTIVDPIVDQPAGSQSPSSEPKEDAAMPSAEEAATRSSPTGMDVDQGDGGGRPTIDDSLEPRGTSDGKTTPTLVFEIVSPPELPKVDSDAPERAPVAEKSSYEDDKVTDETENDQAEKDGIGSPFRFGVGEVEPLDCEIQSCGGKTSPPASPNGRALVGLLTQPGSDDKGFESDSDNDNEGTSPNYQGILSPVATSATQGVAGNAVYSVERPSQELYLTQAMED